MGKIYWFTGQPGAGKTTLAEVIYHSILDHSSEAIHVDGDDIRIMFNNTDYTNYGRERNVERAHDIAYFMSKKGFDVVVSMVSPFRNQRNRFKENPNFVEIYVHTSDIRGREHYHVKDYEKPLENFININTTNTLLEDSIKHLYKEIKI
jgi:adenylylsulfate kinase-like enzyme